MALAKVPCHLQGTIHVPVKDASGDDRGGETGRNQIIILHASNFKVS